MKMNGCYIEDGERILEKLCKDALPKKYGKDTEMLKKAEERLEEELDQIKNITWPDTFEGKRQFASFYLNFYYMITDCGLKKVSIIWVAQLFFLSFVICLIFLIQIHWMNGTGLTTCSMWDL